MWEAEGRDAPITIRRLSTPSRHGHSLKQRSSEKSFSILEFKRTTSEFETKMKGLETKVQEGKYG